MTTSQEDFGAMLQLVLGQAVTALGYTTQGNLTHQARGLFRYQKTLSDGVSIYIEFQLLHYQVGGPSRFRVNLLRNIGMDARAQTIYGNRVDTTLTKLLWDDFKVDMLGSPDHWWVFNNPNELAHALAEAGKLLIGFAIPWLEGTLTPDND